MSSAPLWYQDAVFYELHIRAFCDSNADGVGDFRGATQRLGYLRDLGVTCIWLLPFYASPLKDDGYDIADYYQVHSAYGSLADVREFLRVAHDSGMRVIADLVLNHTSDQHAWFQEARSSPASSKRDYYVWSDTSERYAGARIIFKDFEQSNWTWDPVAQAYYWHRFFSHQPDLNYENPHVQREMLDVMRFWLDLGLDGFRCDAVPHLFEREGTNCENLPETHRYCKALRRIIETFYPDCILIAEANQSPEDTRAYFGDSDEFHLAFYFPLVPRLFLALAREDRQPIAELLAQTPALPPGGQWGIFVRNHDEITLSRLTADERAELLRVYAPLPAMRLNTGIRRRLAPLLTNEQRRIELVHSLILTLPGSPILYYGDEIGMGDDVSLADRNGLRTPMQWTDGLNAGFSHADPARLYLPVIADDTYGYQTVNVERQLQQSSSLLRTLQRLIQVRQSHPVFGRGALVVLPATNRRVLAYLREEEKETILVLHNLSHAAQRVALDLVRFRGARPIDLLGAETTPSISAAPYWCDLPPYGFSWLLLRRAEGVGSEP